MSTFKVAPVGSDVLEIRYRTDESVEVRCRGATSPRTVRRPATSDWLRETGGWHIQVGAGVHLEGRFPGTMDDCDLSGKEK